MSLHVTHFASYLTTTFVEWRGIDHDASKFIKAIKGKPLNGWATVNVRGELRRLESANGYQARQWFAELACDFLRSKRMNPNAKWGLVPFPSRSAVVDETPEAFVSLELAELLASELTKSGFKHVVAADLIRWSERRPSAHDEGGPRAPEQVFQFLQIAAEVPDLDHFILIDDVLTSGARLRSAAALLESHLLTVWKGVVAGRSVQFQPDNPFEVTTDELDDYIPNWVK